MIQKKVFYMIYFCYLSNFITLPEKKCLKLQYDFFFFLSKVNSLPKN